MNLPLRPLAAGFAVVACIQVALAADSVPPAAKSAAADQAVTLSPFEVRADSDNSYGALNSNSITGFNAELDKLPLSANIMTAQFMKDVAPRNIEELITTYSAGSGYAGSDPSTTAGSQPGDITSNAFIQLRGLSSPTMQRDGFMPLGSFGNPGASGIGQTLDFDIERVEIINGPQALLYGNGGAGGVINVVSKQARLGQPAAGSFGFRLDQYGTKIGTFDYGVSHGRVAARVALMDGIQRYNRVSIGGRMKGAYGQFAYALGSTVLRLTGGGTWNDRNSQAAPSLAGDNASGAAYDRNGYDLHYLLATNQTGAVDPATGNAFPSGAIMNGRLNWSNVDSMNGWWVGDHTKNSWVHLTAESRWTRWLSTFAGVGYNNYRDYRPYATVSLYSPLNKSDPIAGSWSSGLNPLVYVSPVRTKAARFAALATTDLFGDRVHSQTLLGADFVRTDAHQYTYQWYQADANFNPVTNPAITTNNGRTPMPTQYFSVDNGPVFNAVFNPQSPRVTIGGVNYVQLLQNPVNPALISPLDPLGVSYGVGTYQQTKQINKGIYGVNYSQWLDRRLDTIVGFRLAQSDQIQLSQGSAPTATSPDPHTVFGAHANGSSFNFGADYRVTDWLHPYASFSDSYQPPYVEAADPYGYPPQMAKGTGEEVGLKLNNASRSISGSISAYHTNSHNEEYLLNGTLTSDINPKGLNGRWNGGNNWVDVDRSSQGIELTLTAAPTKNWRMRLNAAVTDGTIHNTKTYGQLYNDQFFTNSQGQVTYADGAVVYVPSSPNAKNPVATATTGIPLTLDMINNQPNSPYFAFNLSAPPVNGQINNSNLTNVLKYSGPDGAILTGATGIPIAQSQVAPAFKYITPNPPPGVITAVQQGDKTAGYPERSLNFTNMYTFSTGALDGLTLGGTELLGWRNRGYYYYPAGVFPGATRTLFYMPLRLQTNVVASYTRKFSHVTLTVQLNVNNLFNRYGVVLMPNVNTGWASPAAIKAAFWGQPRLYQLTTTLAF